ncbi:MAG: flagellar motor switch protein FliM [Calditrichia bacterium]
MKKILSQDEIDALMENVAGGTADLSNEVDDASLYDFHFPNLISRNRMRVLEEVHESLCRNVSVLISNRLTTMVEMDLLSIEQIRFSGFMSSIATPGCIFECEIEAQETSLLLDFSPQLGIYFVERMLGGRGDFLENVRAVSPVEQTVMRRLINHISEEIANCWLDVDTYKFQVKRFESNPEFVQIFPVDEPVVVVAIEVKIQGRSSLFNICYPFTWISPIISTPEIQQKILHGKKDFSSEEVKTVRSNLLNIPVQLRAVLGHNSISIGDFLDLKTNDFLKLSTKIDEPLSVFVNQRPSYEAVLDSSGKNYSVRITGEVDKLSK